MDCLNQSFTEIFLVLNMDKYFNEKDNFSDSNHTLSGYNVNVSFLIVSLGVNMLSYSNLTFHVTLYIKERILVSFVHKASVILYRN